MFDFLNQGSDPNSMLEIQKRQQMAQMLQQGSQGPNGVLGILGAVLGGFQAHSANADATALQERQKQAQIQQNALIGEALKSGDFSKAAGLFASQQNDPKSMGEAIKMAQDAQLNQSKANAIPSEMYGKYTPDSMAAYQKTHDLNVLQPIDKIEKPNLPTGYRMNGDQAGVIPGMEGYTEAELAAKRKGNGVNVTINPQGNSPLSKENISAEQKNVMNTLTQVRQLGQIAEKFAPQYLSTMAGLEQKGYSALDKMGMATPDQKKFLAGRTEFIQNSEQMFNKYLFAVTGAAASDKQYDKIRNSYLNVDQSPTEFVASANMLQKQMENDLAQAQEMLSSGVPLQAVHAFFQSKPMDFVKSSQTDQAVTANHLQGKAAALGGPPVQIKGDDDPAYTQLPAGASYIAPDGKQRTKK